jgi:CubicO group peptidase (beta-lactamase class C family)
MDVSSPSAQGVRSSGILAFLDALERDAEPHGLIVQRHGHRIAEGYWAPHTADRSRLVYSVSKTFTGTALALQIGEGRLTLDDLVSDHLPEQFDDSTPDATRRMRIRHIASMATGHDRETLLEALTLDPTDPVHGFLSIPPDAEPGTLFAYNQPPVLTLATILQRLAGERLVDYLRPRVLDPLGIGDLRWAQTRSGVDLGYSGVFTDLDAVARLGQLHLDDGVWNGRRILPEGWVADASSVQIANGWDDIDWQQGYGFLLWMSQHGYRGDGAFGQYMVVLPEYDAVVAVFSCIERMQVILDAMWEHLLPAMAADALPPSPDDHELVRRLAHLALPTAAQRVGGQDLAEVPEMTFTRRPGARSHPTIVSVETVIEASGQRMIIREKDRSIALSLTNGWWVDDEASLAASATRLADGTVAVDVVFLATPHRLEIDLDPTAGTFVARWPLVPLFGVGLDPHLASMRPPP